MPRYRCLRLELVPEPNEVLDDEGLVLGLREIFVAHDVRVGNAVYHESPVRGWLESACPKRTLSAEDVASPERVARWLEAAAVFEGDWLMLVQEVWS